MPYAVSYRIAEKANANQPLLTMISNFCQNHIPKHVVDLETVYSYGHCHHILGDSRNSRRSPNCATVCGQTCRIERNFARAPATKRLLYQIVREGVGTSIDLVEEEDLVKVVGDAGSKTVEQLEVHQFASTLQSFISPELHANLSFQNLSLVNGLEDLVEDTRDKNIDMINQVVENTILEDCGSVHLYLSAPNVAALGNHTDTTDIAVL